jgi:hypothetical protein
MLDLRIILLKQLSGLRQKQTHHSHRPNGGRQNHRRFYTGT